MESVNNQISDTMFSPTPLTKSRNKDSLRTDPGMPHIDGVHVNIIHSDCLGTS